MGKETTLLLLLLHTCSDFRHTYMYMPPLLTLLAYTNTGLLVAFLVLLITDPPHGINDDPHTEEEAAAAKARSQWEDYKTIFTNPYFNYCLAGVTANTFCL